MKSEHMPSGREFKYTEIRRDGTFYQGDVPSPEDSPWDHPLTHILLSYKMTGKKIIRDHKVFLVKIIRSQYARIRSTHRRRYR